MTKAALVTSEKAAEMLVISIEWHELEQVTAERRSRGKKLDAISWRIGVGVDVGPADAGLVVSLKEAAAGNVDVDHPHFRERWALNRAVAIWS